MKIKEINLDCAYEFLSTKVLHSKVKVIRTTMGFSPNLKWNNFSTGGCISSFF